MSELTQEQYYSRLHLADTQHIVFFIIENRGMHDEVIGKTGGNCDFMGSYTLQNILNKLKALRAKETRTKNQYPDYQKSWYELDFLVVNDLKKVGA